jgi:two-component system response regulator FlrC
MPLALKPLGARRQDIRAISAALMLRHTPDSEDLAWPTAQALDRLMTHDWPGNVRELENVLQRAMLMRDGLRIEADDLIIDRAPTALRAAPAIPAAVAAPVEVASVVPAIIDVAPVSLAAAKRISQARAIEDALAATGGHRLRAAQRLGISERTLRYRMADMRAVA